MRFYSRIPSWLRNKYLVTLAAFILWMLFFDARDIISQKDRTSELEQLQESKAYFISEIEKEKKALLELKSNPAAIEKLAREKYLMKKDNEDLFIIRENN